MSEILLVGKPNSGKSSLFNQLTGLNQRVGNFSGVTVEKKEGYLNQFKIVDIPGLQSLACVSPDEMVAKNAILNSSSETKVLYVINGTQLHDGLILYSQIADLQRPSMVVVNFSDEMERKGINLDIQALQSRLGCKVFAVNSKNGEKLDELIESINKKQFTIPNAFNLSHYFETNDDALNLFSKSLETESGLSFWEGDFSRRNTLVTSIVKDVCAVTKSNILFKNTNKLDKVLLHPIWGFLIFLAVLFSLFQLLFFISQFPMDAIDSFGTFLIEELTIRFGESSIVSFITNALIPGIIGVVIFVPQLVLLFLMLGLLEQVGYLSRISFISDRFLRKFGLSGHSIIPLVSGWACAIPAVMATRTIENPKERLIAQLITPLMTCSARLPVYAILISVLIDENQTFSGAKGLAMLSLYLLGVIATLLVSIILNKTISVKSNSNWLLELPTFKSPNWKNIGLTIWHKTSSFVWQAGKIIILFSVIVWLATQFSPYSKEEIDSRISNSNELEESIRLKSSYLGVIGQFIEPVIAPLGYDWKIGIGLLSSFAAREVFVGTMSTIYSIGNKDDNDSLINRLKNEKRSDGSIMYDPATGVSLLLFYVFAMQCISTMAVVKKETGKWKYVFLQFAIYFFLAYGSAFTAYQFLS